MIRDRITDNGTLFPALRQGIPGPPGPSGTVIVTVDDTPPADPVDGAGWLDSSTGILSFWSVDADAWIVPSTSTGIPANAYVNGAGYAYVNGSGAYYVAA